MDFLLGNAFATPVGQRIEKATDGSLRSEDWALNMEICDIINETEEGPKDAIRALKKRLVGNKNFQEVMLALTVLEACVKNCGHRFHVLAANQEFVEGVLVRTILPKNNPPAIVHDKVLNLIQAWADAFRSSPDLTGVVTVYEDLRRKGLEFPMTDLDTLSPIHTPQASYVRPELAPRPDLPPNTLQRGGSVSHPEPPPYLSQAQTETSGDAPIIPTAEQIGKLHSELEVVNGNVKVMSEMLTELVPQKATQSDLELLQELNRTCRSMQQRVLELIPRVTHEQLTEELLIVNDNLNNVFLRYERFERIFAGQTGRAAENQTPSNRDASPSLIDLETTSTAAHTSASSLSAQLATINMSPASVSGTLKSLEQGKKQDDDFDMFALTRGSSLAEQRKGVKYEDPQAADGLAVALDTRQQNTGADSFSMGLPETSEYKGSACSPRENEWSGMAHIRPPAPERSSWSNMCHTAPFILSGTARIPAAQNNFMDDIEKWLSVDAGDEIEGEDGVTSEEFDKFLEERAKAADHVPSLPSPPTDGPRVASSTGRDKKEKDEDTFFAL